MYRSYKNGGYIDNKQLKRIIYDNKMRFAIVSYGGLRCGLKHGHTQHWKDTYSEIFNNNNEVDIFIMLNKERKTLGNVTNEEIEEIREIFGDRLKVCEFYEDQPDEVKNLEEKYHNEWLELEQNVTLTDEEIQDFKEDLEKGMQIRSRRNFQIGDLYHVYNHLNMVSHSYMGSKTIKREKTPFVRKQFYRMMIANNFRKKYEKENNVIYDWVVYSNIFQEIYDKKKEFDMFRSPPPPSTVYGAICGTIASSPSIMDDILDNLGHNMPVKKDWSMWHDERFKREMLKWNIHIYFLRNVQLAGEHQMFWQILQSAETFVNLKISCIPEEPNICPDAYFNVCSCSKRHEYD